VFGKKPTDTNGDKEVPVDIEMLPHRILMMQMVFPDGKTQNVACNLDKIVLESEVNCRINIRYANGVTKTVILK